MKKILNWTFGGFFRAFGRVLCFLVIGTIIAYFISKNDFKLPDILGLGLMRVKADTAEYTYKQYRVQYYSLSHGTSAWTSVTSFGTSTTISSGYGVSAISARFGWSSKFHQGQTYRVSVETGFSPASTINNVFLNINTASCYGSTSTSSWNADSSLIQSCDFIGATRVSGTNHVRYLFDIVPNETIIGLQTNISFGGTDEVSSVNVYTKSTITYGADLSSSIDDQTIVIQEEFENITNVITEVNENLINAITDTQEVCNTEKIDKTKGIIDGYLKSSGTIGNENEGYTTTDYIDITNVTKIQGIEGSNGNRLCFYNSNKTLVSCLNKVNNEEIQIPNNSMYLRLTINKNYNIPQLEITYCKNGNQAINESVHGIAEGIHDNNTTEATNEASDFFNNFTTNTHGLTSIITAPLTAIQSLNSSTCTPLHLPIPYLNNQYIDLPCMRSIYDSNFGSFMTLYDTITFGIVSYWIIVRIFSLVKDFKNPEHDEIEVVDL